MEPDSLPSAAEVMSAANIPFVIHRHAEIRTGEDIRTRTEFTEKNVASSLKTLAFAVAPDSVVLAAVPGPARVRYGPLAAAVGVKRSALKPAGADLLRKLNMEPGGVTPVCIDPQVTVIFDAAVPGMGRVLVGSGRSDCTLEVESADIIRLIRNSVITDLTSE